MLTGRASSHNQAVSASRLAELLRDGRLRNPDPAVLGEESMCLSLDQVDALVRDWRKSVTKRAASMEKRSRGTLESLSEECLYERLHDPVWRRAAYVCEVFRSPSVTKNAGWLDVRRLQHRLVEALGRKAPLEFVLAWGQAKRSAGGLKTAGAAADLAELYAVGRLASLIEAIQAHVPDTQVRLVIRSGASRYERALFTRGDVAEEYDTQRQRIATALSPAAAVTVKQYAWESGSGVPEQRFRDRVRDVPGDRVAANFNNVLLNVDWSRILSAAPEIAAPHGIEMPANLRDWLADNRPDSAGRLTRAAITSVINPRYQGLWSEHLDDRTDVLEEALGFVSAVAWEASRSYLALHAMSTTDQEHADPAVRLTVHEKRDRPDIPALLTLGHMGGDLLSQHVALNLDHSGEPSFDTVAEIAEKEPRARPIFVERGLVEQSLFDWLAGSGQPLLFAAGDDSDVWSGLRRVIDRGD